MKKPFIKISAQLLQAIRNNGDVKLFGEYLFLRHKYRNGVIYARSEREMANVLGIDRGRLRRLLNAFKVRGWISVHSGNITFKNNRKLGELYGITRHKTFSVHRDKLSCASSVCVELYKLLLSEKHRHCYYSFRESVKSGHINGSHPYPFGYIENFYAPNNKGEFQISYEGLATVWGCSKTSAFRIMRELLSLGSLDYRKVFIDCSASLGLVADKRAFGDTFSDGSVFILGKRVLKSMPNVYVWE